MRLLGRPQALEEVRCVAATLLRLVAIAFLAQNGSSGDGVNFFRWSKTQATKRGATPQVSVQNQKNQFFEGVSRPRLGCAQLG